MDWLSKLERKYGRYAIPNLMYYVIILYAAGFVLDLINPAFYPTYLSLNAEAILHGQIWRIITFIIEPPSNSLIWILFSLYLYYFIGRQLEAVWGAFRFNVYLFSGVLFHVIGAILVYLVTGASLSLGTHYLNMSLFLVFAMLYPNEQFYLMMIIPVKVKWLAWIDGAYFIWTILQAFLPTYGGNAMYGVYYKASALAAFMALLNFLIFFFSCSKVKMHSPKEVRRKKEFKRNIQQAQRPMNVYENGAKHRCAVCHRTELDGEHLEFRYCSKCNGNYEYCQDHLFTHEHVK